LDALEEQRGYGSLKERLQDEEWIGLYLDLTEQQFWLDPGEGVRFCLPFMVSAAIYQRPITQDATRIGAFFAEQIKRPFHIWWKWIIHSLSSSHDRDTSNEALIGLTELASLVSQREVRFPMPFASFSAELEAALWWQLGEVHMNRDDYQALEWYERALTQLSQDKELKEATTEAYRRVARQLYNKSKFTEGLPFSQRAIEISPDYANAYSSRGGHFTGISSNTS
jgi:tetratricopeptide (TPR) repeat protein